MSRSFVFLFPLLAATIGCSSGEFALATPADVAAIDAAVDAAVDDTASDTSVNADTAEPSDTSLDALETDSSTEDTATTVDAPPVDAGKPCSTNEECTPGLCARRGCETKVGVCLPAAGSATYGPVCGCDGVTYWNELVAAQYSAPISHDEPCILGEAATCAGADCGGLTNSACIFAGTTPDICMSAEKGTCWRVPLGKLCGADPGPAVQTCKGACSSQCDALRNGATTFFTSGCKT